MRFTRDEIASAKELAVSGILEKYGHSPAKNKGKELWYLSPFRQEKTPSFKVDIDKNRWYDHGEGEGGSVIDIVMRLGQMSFVEAVEWLRENSGTLPTPETVKAPQRARNRKIEVVAVKPFGRDRMSKSLIHYLYERGITYNVAKEHLSVVEYRNGDNPRKYYGVGFENQSGGFELRNKYFKGSSSPKDFTIIPGEEREATDLKTCHVFEGWPDFLTYLEMFGHVRPPTDTVVLNSLSMEDKARLFMLDQEYKRVIGWFDNDEAGKEIRQKFAERTEWEYLEWSPGYADHNDLNEFWIDRRSRDDEKKKEYDHPEFIGTRMKTPGPGFNPA